jgi:hypothetical protein
MGFGLERSERRKHMRLVSVLLGASLVVFGLALPTSLLYDAGNVVHRLGLDPPGNEAVVALVGLTVVAVVLALGVRSLRRSLSTAG